MALTTPILYSVPAFDAQNSFVFQFASIGGNQVVANTLTIKNNATLTTVYSVTQTTFKFEHTLPANTLTNGTYYQATLTTKDAQGNESNASVPIQFYCYSQPSFEISNMPTGNVVTNSSYAFTVTYNQAQGETLNAYVFNLYSASGALISTSNTMYNTDTSLPLNVSYLFSGFEDKTTYSIEVNGVTANGTQITTGRISFTTNYTSPETFSDLLLANNCKGGYITIKSNVIGIDGESNPETPVYINDEEIDLRNVGSYVEWREGYTVSGDWTMRLWGRDYTPNSEIFRFSNTKGDIITINYCVDGTYCWFELKVKHKDWLWGYVNESEHITFPNDVKSYSFTLPAGRMRGDVDGDGELTSTDITLIQDVVSEYKTQDDFDTQSWDACDVNADRAVNGKDLIKITNIVAGTNGMTPGSAGPEITGNWTNNPNYATDTAQFYTDIPASQFTSSDKVRIKVDDGAFDKIERVECLDGMVRVYVTLCPINEIPCTIATSNEQQIFCWLRKSDNLYDLRIENRGVES